MTCINYCKFLFTINIDATKNRLYIKRAQGNDVHKNYPKLLVHEVNPAYNQHQVKLFSYNISYQKYEHPHLLQEEYYTMKLDYHIIKPS